MTPGDVADDDVDGVAFVVPIFGLDGDDVADDDVDVDAGNFFSSSPFFSPSLTSSYHYYSFIPSLSYYNS